MNKAAMRIQNQFKEISNNPPLCWKVIPQTQLEWDCWITCDNSSPFYGSPFLVKIKFPQDYPFSVATFQLAEKEVSTFYHPNIYSDGRICEQTLKINDKSLTIRDKIEAFLILLGNPNPNSPANSDAAKLYTSNQNEYYKKARMIFKGVIKK